LTAVNPFSPKFSLYLPLRFCPELAENVNSGKTVEWIEMTADFSVFNADNYLLVCAPTFGKVGIQKFSARESSFAPTFQIVALPLLLNLD